MQALYIDGYGVVHFCVVVLYACIISSLYHCLVYLQHVLVFTKAQQKNIIPPDLKSNGLTLTAHLEIFMNS